MNRPIVFLIMLASIFIGAVYAKRQGWIPTEIRQADGTWKAPTQSPKVKPQIVEVEVPRFELVDFEPASELDEIIAECASEYGQPPLLIKAMIMQESPHPREAYPEVYPYRMRTENHLWKRKEYKKTLSKCVDSIGRGLNTVEKNICVTSYGYMQIIYGFHKDKCGLESFVDLLDTKTNICCGAKIMRDLEDRHVEIKNSKQRYTKVLHGYNGGAEYPGKVFSHMAGLILEQ